MREQSDGALRVTLRKVYGSIEAMPRAELRRRLLSIPELFYYTDELVDEACRREILVVASPYDAPDTANPALDLLRIAGVKGNLEGWPYTDEG